MCCALGAILFTGWTSVASDPEVTARSGPFELRLSVAKSEYRSGETVGLVFDLRNAGTETATMLSFARSLFGFAAYDPNGHQLAAPRPPRWPILAPPIAVPLVRTLEPGKSISAKLSWDLAPSGWQAPAATGSYTLIGYAWWDREGAPRLQTPPLVIRVVAGVP